MNKKAHFAGIAFAVIFGFSFLFSKIALDHVSPVGLIAYRFLLAFIVFEILRQLKIIKIRFERKHWKSWLAVAFFQPILYFLFETYGLARTSSGEAGMMIALIPIFVSLLGSVILKEKPRAIQYFFILISVSGIVFIQVMKPGAQVAGETLGFVLLSLAVISAALFNIASRKASQSMKPFEITYFMMLVGAVSFNLIYVVQLASSGDIGGYFSVFGHTEFIFPILYLGIIASIGGFFMMNYALSQLPAHVSSIYSNLSTIVAIVIGAVILKETLSWYHLIGSVLIIGGVYGTVRTNRSTEIAKID